MKCVIPGANVKVFGRAVHSLHKIGDELYIEALENGLALRTVNSSRSAFTSFVFAPSFFITYNQVDGSATSNDALKCKISLKLRFGNILDLLNSYPCVSARVNQARFLSVIDELGSALAHFEIPYVSCITVFKSLTTLEKTVEKCKISLHPDEDRLIFQLYCHHGIVKTHRLRFMECDSLQAVYSKQLCPNVLVCQTKLLCDTVMNFQQGQEEITLIATPVKLVVKNHVDDTDPDANKAVRTELSLCPDEFDSYTVGVDVEITFCLKELRAALFFSEASNLPVSLHFESPGKPIIFAISGDATFEANLVLATLAADALTSSQSVSGSQQVSSSNHSGVRLQASSSGVKRSSNGTSNETSTRSNAKVVKPQSSGYSVNVNQSTDDQNQMETFDIHDNTTIGRVLNTVEANDSQSVASSEQCIGTAVVCESRTSVAVVVDPDPAVEDTSPFKEQSSSNTERTVNSQAEAKAHLFDLVGLDSPTMHHDAEASDSDEREEVEDNVIPGTPPNKKFKSLFFGLSQSTTSGSQATQLHPVVLAEDSEED